VSVLRDAALLSPAQRENASLRFSRGMKRIADPPGLSWFNFEACEQHKPDPHPLCRSCGIVPRNHQWVGALRMYAGLPGLLSDCTGSGKTGTAIMTLAMYKQMGHLSYGRRAVIVAQPNAMSDPWAKDLARLVPGIDVIIADGSPKQRREAYAGDWEVAVVSSRTFAPAAGTKTQRPGDVDILLALGTVDILICDDVDELRSPGTRTFRAVVRFARACSRVHILHATPLQKRLMELWAFLVAVGGSAPNRLGAEERCRQRYVTRTRKSITIPDPSDKTGRKRARRTIWVDNGMRQNPELVAEFRARIAPLVLRRTAADLDDVTLPEVQVSQVWLDLSRDQRRRYDELRDGVLRRLRGDGEEVSYKAAVAAFNYGQQICGGLAALDEGPETPGSSVKLDWVMNALTGDLAEDKVICFVHNQGNVRALSRRLRAENIGHVLLWGEMTDKKRRAERLRLFREDDRARVLVGSLTIKKSLNLQVARHMIGVDTILNPAGMEQLIGRFRRQGSPFPMVFFHHLLARLTQEDAYPALLRREQETADLVWDEQSDIRWVLSPRQLLRMVAEGRVGTR
jgi:superfamily II DNA or RNA helicase